ncbi:hypothetical protein [Aeromonas allosaccharophila]
MSRWIENFKSHAFQDIWSQILSLSENVTPDDITITTDTTEIARFKKVITFINELILACDPELIPEQTWVNFHSQASACLQYIINFQNTRSIQYIVQANASLDNLITYVRPYQVVTGESVKAVQKAFSVYAKEIGSSLNTFTQNAKECLAEITSMEKQATENLESCDRINTRIINLEEYLFDDSVTPK